MQRNPNTQPFFYYLYLALIVIIAGAIAATAWFLKQRDKICQMSKM